MTGDGGNEVVKMWERLFRCKGSPGDGTVHLLTERLVIPGRRGAQPGYEVDVRPAPDGPVPAARSTYTAIGLLGYGPGHNGQDRGLSFVAEHILSVRAMVVSHSEEPHHWCRSD